MDIRFNIESCFVSSSSIKSIDRYTFRWIRGLTPFFKYTIGSIEIRLFNYLMSIGFTLNKRI